MTSKPRVHLHNSEKDVLGKTSQKVDAQSGATEDAGKKTRRKKRHAQVAQAQQQVLESLATYFLLLKEMRKNRSQEETAKEFESFLQKMRRAAMAFRKKSPPEPKAIKKVMREVVENKNVTNTPEELPTPLGTKPDLHFEDNGWISASTAQSLRRFHPLVVLYSPQIPPNTGTIARLCAAQSASLHLIEPLGFVISDKALRRAGLDYWNEVDLHVHKNWESFEALIGERRLVIVETGSGNEPAHFEFCAGDVLLFGSETKGVPSELIARLVKEKNAQLVTIPMFHRGVRSLNLANTVSIVLYEAIARLHGAPLSK